MQRMNTTAYLSSCKLHTQNMFMKSTTGVNFYKTFSLSYTLRKHKC
jgi:hypothetical protein